MAGTVAMQQPAAVEGQQPGLPSTLQHKSALYVGELDPQVNEGQLFEIFNSMGPVHSIRVCRDVVTRRSLGYAYVNYNSSADPQAAAKAIEQLNYLEINNKPIRIMWSDRDPSQRRSGQGNVFIKNLDPSIDHKALHDTFVQFGKILSCKIATDENGKTKGYGFVHFESADSAKQAIAKVNNKKLRNAVVYVGQFVKRQDRMQQHEKQFTNLYVKNLADDCDDEGLRDMFSKFGEINSAKVMKDESGKSKKFGFVDFKDPGAAKAAINELGPGESNNDGTSGGSQRLYVARAQKKSERKQLLQQHYDSLRRERIKEQSGKNVYVRNLAEQVDDEALRKEFAQFGTITSAKVMMDDTNLISRGFGFVCFSTPEEAQSAIHQKHNAMLHGKPLFVTLAQPKEVRNAQTAEQMQGGMMPGRAPQAPPAMGPTFVPPNLMYPGPMQAPGQVVWPPPGMGPRPGMGRGRGRGIQPGYGVARPQAMLPPYHQGPPGMGPPQRMPAQQRPQRTRGSFPGRTPQRQQYQAYGGGAATYYQGGGRGRGEATYRGRGGRGAARGSGREGASSRQPTPPGVQVQQPPGGVPAGAAMQPAAQMNPEKPSDGLDAAHLATMSVEEQKQMIGEKLFENIDAMLDNKPQQSGKVTGMLLEMDTSELLLLYENHQYLQQKVQEALFVLKEAGMDAEGETQEPAA